MGFLFDRITYLISNAIIILPTVLIALMGHELAHGWVSYKLGDPTPKYEGRLTFNPLKHLDPLGTLLMILTGFGWAKPVSVNPMYYKDRKKGMALVAFAGPLANFVMAFLGMMIGLLIMKLFSANESVMMWVGNFTSSFVSMNLCFMVFNLIPLPPLDGSKILGMFLPNRTYYKMLQYEQYSMFLLMFLSLAGIFDVIIGRGVGFFWDIIQSSALALIF